MGGLTTSYVGDPFFFYFSCMCFRLAQGCRKGGPNTKWLGKNMRTDQTQSGNRIRVRHGTILFEKHKNKLECLSNLFFLSYRLAFCAIWRKGYEFLSDPGGPGWRLGERVGRERYLIETTSKPHVAQRAGGISS